MAKNKQVICPRRKQKYFCNQGWTGQINLKRFGQSGVARIERDRF